MADINVEETLKKLSMADKVDLLAGIDFWHTKALPEHGIPSLRLTDGPNGVRGTKFFNGVKAACFPCGTALGATFNTELLRAAGRTMGEEAKAKGAHAILGPTINMQRGPLGGRGFESIGEDPVLAGLGAAALVAGIQATGVQAAVKHFVCNDHEHRRNAVQALVTPRALREIYALPFQLAVRGARPPGAVMTAYNGVNGTFCSENPRLLDALLRREWGWRGLVLSDWYGTYSTTAAALAGLDLEMPGPPRFRGDALKFNAAGDKVRAHVLDERARAVLRFVKACAASGVPEHAPENEADTPETARLLRQVATESIVLLKNDNNVLPFSKDKKTVVIGPNAKVATYHGGGSASLAAYYAVTPFDGISGKLSSPPGYALGQYSHKLLPLLGYSTKSLRGADGMTMKVFLDGPEVGGRQAVDEIEIARTEMLLVDYANPKITSALWYATLEGALTADDVDGDWDFGVVVSGTANLYIDGALVVDNSTAQAPGDAFFGSATREEKGRYPLRKGRTYHVQVTFGSAPTSKLGGDAVLLAGGALRVGGCRVVDPAAEIARAAALARTAEQVVVCAGLSAEWESEGGDRADMRLPPGSDALIAAVARANPHNTAVVLQSGTPVEMPWADAVPALAQAWYGGNETGGAIADVLFGDACPSGRLPLSFPARLQDTPTYLNYRTEGGRVLYGEDVYVGYRYYEAVGRRVRFPFGHGLSYTRFAFAGPGPEVVRRRRRRRRDSKQQQKEEEEEEDGGDDEILEVTVSVENTGPVKGAQVAQLYVAPLQEAAVRRPLKELKGFAKVLLEPGECRPVTIRVPTKYAAAYWDEVREQWCVEAGAYRLIVSDSSEVKEGCAVTGEFKVDETYWWSGL
ncbi:glycoside hydrolase family 3 protein [Xylariomycetidae sp. FL0641]|nr:glycoside hydrolase family 3 protein [Xylariomycetidae sp. FL0641]